MKTFIAYKRTFTEGTETKNEKMFKSEKQATDQIENWYLELLKDGYIITSVTLGRLSKSGEDVFLGYDEI